MNRFTRLKPKDRHVTQIVYIVRERAVPMANYNYSVRHSVVFFTSFVRIRYEGLLLYCNILRIIIFCYHDVAIRKRRTLFEYSLASM